MRENFSIYTRFRTVVTCTNMNVCNNTLNLTKDFTQCSCGDSTNPNCENMNISQGDTDMPNQSCIRFARNAPTYWTSSCTKTTYREQINNQTSYMDLSNIYGISKTESDSLRTKNGGQLRTSPGLSANRTYLPKSPTKQCSRDANETLKCFLNGDVHVNRQVFGQNKIIGA